MQLLKCAGCAGVATGSILVYAYILMYYTKNRGFREGGYLKAEGEGLRRWARLRLRLRRGLRCATRFLVLPPCAFDWFLVTTKTRKHEVGRQKTGVRSKLFATD